MTVISSCRTGSFVVDVGRKYTKLPPRSRNISVRNASGPKLGFSVPSLRRLQGFQYQGYSKVTESRISDDREATYCIVYWSLLSPSWGGQSCQTWILPSVFSLMTTDDDDGRTRQHRSTFSFCTVIIDLRYRITIDHG
jgi:hypothetical protein